MAHTRCIAGNKDKVVEDLLEAIKQVYPGLFVQKDLHIVMLNRDRKYRVGLISGGCAGHEPFPLGYVGEGMLTAALIGSVFTGPPIGKILAAILSVAKCNKGGVLLIIMNYPGDVLSYSAAMEVARTKGYNIESIIVSDDVSHYGLNTKGITGQKGMVGVMLMAKILGGYSKEGKQLNELAMIGRCLNFRLGTIGVTFEACTMPGEDKPLFTIPDGKVEFGMGLHGEAGIATIDMPPLKELVKEMISKIMVCLEVEEHGQLVVVVNNLGALSQMEISIISKQVYSQIKELNFKIERFYMGTFVTSLNTRGFQICLLNVTNQTKLLPYLDEETEAFAWPGKRISRFIEKFPPRIEKIEIETPVLKCDGMKLNDKHGELFRKCLKEVSYALIAERNYLDRLDSESGDGDCGTTFARFAEAILRDLKDFPVNDVPKTLIMLAKFAETVIGSMLGAIFVLLLLGAAKDCESWESSWLAGIEMVQKYSRARLGDRSLLDALIPACQGFLVHINENGDRSWPIALKIALKRAEEGCEATKYMVPRVGRALYFDPSRIKDVDAGAYAIVVMLRTLVKLLVTREDVFRCPQ